MNKKLVLYHMDVKTAMIFYKMCEILKVGDDMAKKHQILVYLANKGKVSISETTRNLDDVLRDYKNHYGNILHIKPKKKEEE